MFNTNLRIGNPCTRLQYMLHKSYVKLIKCSFHSRPTAILVTAIIFLGHTSRNSLGICTETKGIHVIYQTIWDTFESERVCKYYICQGNRWKLERSKLKYLVILSVYTYVGVTLYFNLIYMAAYFTLFIFFFSHYGKFWIYLQKLYIKFLILYNVYVDTSFFPLLTFRLFPFLFLLL